MDLFSLIVYGIVIVLVIVCCGVFGAGIAVFCSEPQEWRRSVAANILIEESEWLGRQTRSLTMFLESGGREPISPPLRWRFYDQL